LLPLLFFISQNLAKDQALAAVPSVVTLVWGMFTGYWVRNSLI
jgi:hypothetical protein